MLRRALAHNPPAAEAPPLLERNGGWWLSAALHLMAFALLFLYKLPPQLEKRERAEPIRVVLAEAPAPAVAMAAPAAQTSALQPVFSPAGAVHANRPENENAPRREASAARATQRRAVEVLPPETVAVPVPKEAAAAEPAEGAKVADWLKQPAESDAAPPGGGTDAAARPDNLAAAAHAPARAADGTADAAQKLSPEQQALLQRLQSEGQALAAQNNAQAARGSAAVGEKLKLARVDAAAQKVLFNSKGAEEGAVRELDLSGVSQEEAYKVLARYGIRIISTTMGVISEGPGFLSSAVTRSGRFTNTSTRGPVEIFQYGPQAIARMLQLETAALKEKGYSPETARVVSVTFGIVATPLGYDLAVKRLEANAVPGAGSGGGNEMNRK